MSVAADARGPEHSDRFMQRAISLSETAVDERGGPFGAVVVCGDSIAGEGSNSVRLTNDPTAHAEIAAIRAACARLQRYELSDCVLYTSTYPCPMCLGAILWARIPLVRYANTAEDAREIGFADADFYQDLRLAANPRNVELQRTPSAELRRRARAAFERWHALPNREPY